ncbi:MAG: hypothetical protein ACLTD2_03565 [Ruminococcus sp.]
MSLFGNYNTPGRGVLKAPQEKKGIFKFFEVYGRHMWKLMELNLLYFVFCIPMTLMVILMLMTSNPNMALTGDTVSIGRTCNGCNDKGLPKLFSGKKCVFAT